MKLLHILHTEAAAGWGGQEIRVLQETRLLLERGAYSFLGMSGGQPSRRTRQIYFQLAVSSYPNINEECLESLGISDLVSLCFKE